MEITEYFKTWSEKLSMPEEEISKKYNDYLADEKESHKDLSEDEQQKQALKRVALEFKKQLRSPAVGFEGVVVAVSDAIDIVAKTRRLATEQFTANPEQAVSQGVCNAEGEPLDTRAEWGNGQPNQNFGKPLPQHNFLKNVWGIAKKSSIEDTYKLFSMLISGPNAEKDNISVFEPVNFRAIDKTVAEDIDKKYTLNASQFTLFEKSDKEMPDVEELLKEHCGELLVNINGLTEWHEEHAANFNRLAIVKGDVSSLNPTPTSVGSRVMTLENEDAIDIESAGITCWIPPRCKIDFDEQSKVIVIGRTGRGKKRDAAGTVTDEPGDVTMNVYGLFAIPKYKIEPESPDTDSAEEVKPEAEGESGW